MRIVGGCVVVVLALGLTGCGSGGAGPSIADSGGGARPHHNRAAAATAPKLRTLTEVADAACAGKRVAVRKPGDHQLFTSAGATCGPNTTVAMFAGPAARDNYAAFLGKNAAALVGTNWLVWIDTFNNEAAYQRIQAKVGGRIVTGKS